MAILNNIFSEDSESENQSVATAQSDGAVNLGIDRESSDTDEDGETETSSDSTDIGGDFNTDTLLGSANRSESDSDDGGLLG